MGYVHAEIELSNPKEGTLGRLTTTALVDTGALTLCIPEHIRLHRGTVCRNTNNMVNSIVNNAIEVTICHQSVPMN